MIYFHKILPLLLSPLMIALLLLLISFITRQQIFTLITAAFMFILSLPIASNSLLSFIEAGYLKIDPLSLPKADAIIVLSGMLDTIATSKGIDYEWEDPDRFFGGLELYKLHKADKLVFTGGKVPWQKSTKTEGEILKKYAIEMGVNEIDIIVTGEAENTAQEAAAARKLFSQQNPHIILVTSAFHMRRSKYLFISSGFNVTEFPVDFKIQLKSLTPMDFLPQAWALAKSELALREALGFFYYRLIL